MNEIKISKRSRYEYEKSKYDLKKIYRAGVCIYNPNDYVVHAGVLKRYEGASVIAHIPYGVVEIADGAFAGYDKLAEVIIPDTVTTIGEKAFYGCTSIEYIDIPASVTEIKHKAFYGCTSLERIGFEKSDKSLYIESSAFQLCSALEALDTKRDIEYIGKYAFAECFSLRKLILRNKDQIFIDESAFRNCHALAHAEFYSVLSFKYPFLDHCRTASFSRLRRVILNKRSYVKNTVCCGVPISRFGGKCRNCGLKHKKRSF